VYVFQFLCTPRKKLKYKHFAINSTNICSIINMPKEIKQKEIKNKVVEMKFNNNRCWGRVVKEGAQCLQKPENKTHFCNKHHHMDDYTKDMINKSTKCWKCQKMVFKNGKLCPVCDKDKEECKLCNIPEDYGGYCKTHYKWAKKEELDEEGKQVCSFFKSRGCFKEVDPDNGISCKTCRIRDANNEKKRNRKANRKKKLMQSNNSDISEDDSNEDTKQHIKPNNKRNTKQHVTSDSESDDE
jgi:hypothetical protein